MTTSAPENPKGDPPPSVLVRKTQVGRVEHQARAMSVPKALRLTLAKAADDLFDLAMAAIGVRMEMRSGDALGDLFGEQTLLMTLDGPSGRSGAAVFDGVLVGGLIQQQTMGTVMPQVDNTARALTATDAAICAPFLDALLGRAAVLPETEEERHLLEGYRFGIKAEDARLLQMTLEAPEYQIVHITVDIAGGKRQGQIVLCLPKQATLQDVPKQQEDDDSSTPRRQKMLNATVLGLKIELNVALARKSMPLSALGTLAVGDVLELGVTSFDQSRILTMSGSTVGRGTLGQIGGKRALRVNHQRVVTQTPKRRASDRAELDLPAVTGDGTGTRIVVEGPVEQSSGMDFPRATQDETSDTALPLDELPNLPDMSDLPGLEDIDEFTDEPLTQAG